MYNLACSEDQPPWVAYNLTYHGGVLKLVYLSAIGSKGIKQFKGAILRLGGVNDRLNDDMVVQRF